MSLYRACPEHVPSLPGACRARGETTGGHRPALVIRLITNAASVAEVAKLQYQIKMREQQAGQQSGPARKAKPHKKKWLPYGLYRKQLGKNNVQQASKGDGKHSGKVSKKGQHLKLMSSLLNPSVAAKTVSWTSS